MDVLRVVTGPCCSDSNDELVNVEVPSTSQTTVRSWADGGHWGPAMLGERRRKIMAR